ncbi:MAG: M20 aminoacylase family protein [Pseudomonadota bacterium]
MLSTELIDEFIGWRHHLHAHPELAYQEHGTSAFVIDRLKEFGCDIYTGFAETGVVGVLDYGPGPAIGIRADMDALPLTEQTGLSYASQQNGVMHACGHDGHTTIALGAAKLLASRDDFSGKLVFIFQPAEENEGGARRMLEDGLFEQHPVDAVFGLHNMPGVPVGEVWVRSGAVSASFDSFEVLFTGRGGHGAMPEFTVDPIPAAASAVLSLQTLVSRNVAALDSAVLSVCALEAGDTYNVIPDTARIKGSYRTLNPKVQKKLRARVEEVLAGVAQGYGVEVQTQIEERYPPVVNSEREADIVKAVVAKTQDEFTLRDEFAPTMGSEDFAFFLQQRPGCFCLIGNGKDAAPLHSPHYQFEDSAIAGGVRLWTLIAEHYLA